MARFEDVPPARRSAKRAADGEAPPPLPAPPPRAPAPSSDLAAVRQRVARQHLRRGRAAEARGEVGQALNRYTRAHRADPTLGAPLLALGKLRERLGNRREAEALYGRAARSDDAGAAALEARARLRRRQGRRDAAFLDLQTAVGRDPSRAARIELLAGWYVERQQWLPALALYRRRLEQLHQEPAGAERRRVAVQVLALSLLAAARDPVQRHHNPVRRSLAAIARRRAARASR